MNRALHRRYLAQSWLMFFAIALGIGLFCWFRVWIVGELDTSQFRQIIDLLPKDWRKFASVDFDWLVSYLGRTSLALDEPMLIMLVTGWAMVRGSDVVSGELSRGTMEMLLAQPISRRRFYLTHAGWTIGLLAVLVLIAWGGMSLGIATTSVEETSYPEIYIPVWNHHIPLTFLEPQTETIAMVTQVNPILFWAGLINLFCLAFFLGGFAAFCSSWDRYRWRTLGIVVGFYFCNAGLKMLGMASEKMRWVMHCSIFGCYTPSSAIARWEKEPGSIWELVAWDHEGHLIGLGTLGNYLVLLLLGILFYGWGCRIFERRDLPAPV